MQLTAQVEFIKKALQNRSQFRGRLAQKYITLGHSMK